MAYGEALSYYVADNRKDGKILLYLLNPAAVKSYGEALMPHNKNDAVDAKLIAMFVASMTESGQVEPWKAPTKAERGLKELTRRRAGLVSQKDAERDRLEQLGSRASATQAVIQNAREHITLLEELIGEIEKHIDDSGLRETTDLLRSIDGMGPVSSSAFIGEMGDSAQPPIEDKPLPKRKKPRLTRRDSAQREAVGHIGSQPFGNQPARQQGSKTGALHGDLSSDAEKRSHKRILQTAA